VRVLLRGSQKGGPAIASNTAVDVDRFPEWEAFAAAVQARRPETGTWCESWTVRDIVAHQAGNAEELARVLGAHLAGEPLATRSFEEREAPYRVMSDSDLWAALLRRMVELGRVADAGETVPADTDVAWTGRTMKVSWFAEHMREEIVLHGWDITGDDAAAQARLAEPWMTEHSVIAVGAPLLAKGAKKLRLQAGEHFEGRLRVSGHDDITVRAETGRTTIQEGPCDGPPTLETDPAARVLLLWGRRPADPSRICSNAGAATLGRLRTLLSGY
jgi:uncharacterized protein (TIGR03083 family)